MSQVQAAVLADAPTLGAMQLNAFDDGHFDDMFPQPYVVAAWENFVRPSETAEHGLESRVGVIRDESGTAKGACLLHIARDKDALAALYSPWETIWGAPLPGMNTAKLDEFFGGMTAQHKAVLGDTPHVYVEIVMTHSTARGRGHSLTLLKWASDIADELGLPLYLNSDKDVVGLYERVGYVRQPEEVRTSKMVPMLRPAVEA
ncbi:hypothetical protein HC256_008322 [Beauveria bassiana]|uniref:Acyl-CoA N-acyltransferase n=1 Tax=Beauveria bassiana (strain ARSEF 2860) TaxID=655819 RepID=J4W6N2_BEAB2|nr:Acyl-CoA N-acyltransferase [Beauveria bassiana ARSEF 2860]EJP65960.1 Acyl-CoA N-acyltransferase [Beauveria bassiana ARSEF 2860]KAH8711507.1 hypothetical protein HC256_008322 [Beauveria bassiana]